MILGQHSGVAQLFANISPESNPQKNTTWLRIAYIPSHAAVSKFTKARHATLRK